MHKTFLTTLKHIYSKAKRSLHELNTAPPYELKNISSCPKTGNHLLHIKVIGKPHCLELLAEEVASNNALINSLSPTDIRTICYLAASDKYEKILQEEKIKKTYELLKSKTINGIKSAQIRDTINGEITLIPLKDFSHQDVIEKLKPIDVYQIGYLAGQEQTLNLIAKIKVVKNNNR